MTKGTFPNQVSLGTKLVACAYVALTKSDIMCVLQH
ncbi:hypothetical protein CWB66_13705 [Pseudoalteromonas sp. S558]|nr:hypothetical protein CWB66_13705 [Pseudoalteromonas sp. S558]